MFQKKIAIDLGTTTVLVYVPKRGIIINEPSVVAVSYTDKKVLAVGKEAKDMLGRTPDTIVARRPLKDGVIADYRTTEAMLRYFINKALGGVLTDYCLDISKKWGLKRVVAQTMSENQRMIALFRKRGFTITCDEDSSTVFFEKELAA